MRYAFTTFDVEYVYLFIVIYTICFLIYQKSDFILYAI